jgi:hypothetical protein
MWTPQGCRLSLSSAVSASLLRQSALIGLEFNCCFTCSCFLAQSESSDPSPSSFAGERMLKSLSRVSDNPLTKFNNGSDDAEVTRLSAPLAANKSKNMGSSIFSPPFVRTRRRVYWGESIRQTDYSVSKYIKLLVQIFNLLQLNAWNVITYK